MGKRMTVFAVGYEYEVEGKLMPIYCLVALFCSEDDAKAYAHRVQHEGSKPLAHLPELTVTEQEIY